MIDCLTLKTDAQLTSETSVTTNQWTGRNIAEYLPYTVFCLYGSK
jgi:hypothetical protein